MYYKLSLCLPFILYSSFSRLFAVHHIVRSAFKAVKCIIITLCTVHTTLYYTTDICLHIWQKSLHLMENISIPKWKNKTKKRQIVQLASGYECLGFSPMRTSYLCKAQIPHFFLFCYGNIFSVFYLCTKVSSAWRT